MALEGERSPRSAGETGVFGTGVRYRPTVMTSARYWGKWMAPFHIKAQALRLRQLEPGTALGVFDPRSSGAEPPAHDGNKREKAPWRQSDIKRMIAAAEQAGLVSYRVEAAPDGTLSIIVGAPGDTAEEPDSTSWLVP